MGLSSVLSPETATLELQASEGEMAVDSADAWFGVGPLGERFL